MKTLPLLALLLSGCAPVCHQMKGIFVPPIQVRQVANVCPDRVIVIPNLVKGD